MMNSLRGKYWLGLCALVVVSLTASGCVWVLVGGAAAAGGYAVSRDTIQGEIDHSFDEIWDATKEIMGIMGTIESESYELGRIKGLASGARVQINILQMTPSTVRLKIKARKFIFPSIANAQAIYIEIMDKLDKGI